MQTQMLSEQRSAAVLVVDDQTSSRSILTELLQKIKPKVSIIEKGHPQEALDWAVHHSVDLVLVDYMMPDMNGIHFTKVLRTIPSYTFIPIVMVTIVDDADTKQLALQAGVTDFLSKPINLQECFTRCQNLLSIQHRQVHLSQERIMLEHQLRLAKQTISQIEHETIQLLMHVIYQTPKQLQRAQRVARYAKLLGEVCGLNTLEQAQLEQASLLFEIDTLHNQIQDTTAANIPWPTSAQLLSQSHSPLFKMAADIAKHHRDSYAPHIETQQRRGSDIPLSARLVAITEHFDQISYPNANTDNLETPSVAYALKRLASEAGLTFDPHLVKQLISIRPRLEKVYEDYLAKNHP